MPLDGSALRAVVHVLSAEPKRLAAFALTGAAPPGSLLPSLSPVREVPPRERVFKP